MNWFKKQLVKLLVKFTTKKLSFESSGVNPLLVRFREQVKNLLPEDAKREHIEDLVKKAVLNIKMSGMHSMFESAGINENTIRQTFIEVLEERQE